MLTLRATRRDNWAKTVAINKNVKIYIGAPASSTAAGSGYVDATTLANIAIATRGNYSSFGGVMLWDASQAYGEQTILRAVQGCMLIESRMKANNRFDQAIKNAIKQSGNGGTTSNPVTVPTTGPTTTQPSTTTSAPTTTSVPTTTAPTTTAPATTTATSGNCAGVASWVANVAVSAPAPRHYIPTSSLPVGFI